MSFARLIHVLVSSEQLRNGLHGRIHVFPKSIGIWPTINQSAHNLGPIGRNYSISRTKHMVRANFTRSAIFHSVERHGQSVTIYFKSEDDLRVALASQSS